MTLVDEKPQERPACMCGHPLSAHQKGVCSDCLILEPERRKWRHEYEPEL